MWGGNHDEPETKENPMNMRMRKSSRVAPAPQIKAAAKPGTFIDDGDDMHNIVPGTKNKDGSSSKTGSPVRTQRVKTFMVEGDTPYSVDIDSNFGHGTQTAIDGLADEIDEEMAYLDKRLEGMVRGDGGARGGRVRGVKERSKGKFHVEKARKKIKGSLNKMRLVRSGMADDGTGFIRSSSDEEEDEAALMSGLNNEAMGASAGGPQLVTQIDPNIKKQLILALKMKRTYKSALQGVSEKYRKLMVDIDKLHMELAKTQEELDIAHRQEARHGGGGLASFAVNTGNGSKRDEEDRARRDRERKKLLMSAGGGGGDEMEAEIDSNQPQALKLCNKLGKLYQKYKPLRNDVNKIEQRFGTSVASYFHFYQWMFLNSIIVWLLYATGFGYHLYLNTSLCVEVGDSSNDYKSLDVQFIACRPKGVCIVTNEDTEIDGVGLPCHVDGHCYDYKEKCLTEDQTTPACRNSKYRDATMNNDAIIGPKKDARGFVTTGKCNTKYANEYGGGRIAFAFETSTPGSWVPELFMFSSFQASEAWIYTCMLLLSILVMMVQTVIKWSAEDRKLKMITAFEGSKDSQNKYAKLVLNAWDHNLNSVRDSRDHKLFIAESLRMLVQDAEAAESSGSRTLIQKAKLYARRAFFILLYIIIQIGGMSLIVITLAGQNATIKSFGEQVFEFTSGAVEITPIVVGIVNGVIPQLTTRLLKQEKYDDQGTIIKQTVLRIFLTKTFNILIQVVSYLLLQDPFLFAAMDSPPQFLGTWHQEVPSLQMINIRSIFKKAFSTSLDNSDRALATSADFSNKCRVNQVGLNLFSFLYIAFATEIVMAFLFPAIALITSLVKKKPIKKSAFDVALKMIGLLYFMQICLFTMPFMPLVGCIFIFLLFFKFKMEFYLTNYFGKKPKKAWAAKDSGEFFLQFYLVSVFIWIIINYLFLVSTTQPKTCSAQFKFLAETVELDGSSYPRMNLITEECDLLWHDLEGSSSKRSAVDYLFDEYVSLPPPCWSPGLGYVDINGKECLPCGWDPATVPIKERTAFLAKCSGKTSTMQVSFLIKKFYNLLTFLITYIFLDLNTDFVSL